MADLLTRVTIWVALGLFTAAQVSRRQAPWRAETGLGPSAIGWACFAAHVLLAYGAHYEWSHAVAYAETAEQTAALTGLDWGGGLHFNYLFGLVWLADLVWWVRNPAGYNTRPRWMELTVRAFFLFMILNGAVVFVAGLQRWLGAGLLTLLIWAWRPGGTAQPTSRS